MKGMIILANGFEDVEAIATIDILRRAKIDIDVYSFDDDYTITTSSGLVIRLDESIIRSDYKKYDFLVLPGGKATFNYLDKSILVDEIVDYFGNNNKYMFAICAAPMILGKNGFLKNKHYTVFPGCGDKIIGGIYDSNPVVKDGNIITARSMYYANDFALKIVETILGKDVATIIEKQVKGEN